MFCLWVYFLLLFIPIVLLIYILRKKLNNDDASALSGTYGSVSAVTFVTAITYLSTSGDQVF